LVKSTLVPRFDIPYIFHDGQTARLLPLSTKKREEKKVRIANYLQGPSNCIASSTYYSAAKQTVDKTRDGFYGDR
jgi:hypothetical protein